MSFRNAVILSFCIAAGLEVFSGCAYNDKYVEIVLVDSGRQPESVPSQSQNHIPADTGNEANSVYAPEEVTYYGVGKAEEKQEQRPKKSAKPTALPDVTPTPLPTATPTPTITLLPTPLPTPKPTPAATWTPRPTNTPEPTPDALEEKYSDELAAENAGHDEREREINARYERSIGTCRQSLNILLEKPSDDSEYYGALEQVKSELEAERAKLEGELAQEEARHEQTVKDINAKYGKQ